MKIATEKRERFLGEHLHLKAWRCASPKCALVRRPYRPGAHGPRGRQRALSDFGRQIREKQKFKITYGVDERGLKRLFDDAKKNPGSTGGKILEFLERRLDNVVFRMGLAPSRSVARQLVTHGHILVDNKKTTAPGFQVGEKNIVAVRKESQGRAMFRDLKEYLKRYETPAWVSLDAEKMEGRVIAPPMTDNFPFDVNLLVESFSK